MKHCIALLGLSVAMVGGALASEDLAKAKNCMTCHSVDKKIVGPSYKDIVAKRGAEKGAEAALAAKIKGGSKNEWGMVPMPPNNVSDAEAATLAKWVLTLK
ncbi:c-type cytochrome [Dechloromonas sp. TW-R-39-2]|uniref:c-type cytochrome n=1 Tax=Dechloromonas sp. TW-R-39-2 TaxID=2654218 RepID=UPI00193D2A05|nr:c-type cytochrome [Dechloromonas sp. TW-R-39-2]QRM18898.1 c-type cytochrome [Dechloromonas sp. TW-R-39-2]